MVKLTVIYTLPEDADHEEFLRWRTTEHQKSNMETPGVIKSDFYVVREIYTHKSAPSDDGQKAIPEDSRESVGLEDHREEVGSEDRLEKEPLYYRYMTEAYWPDMESFKSAFFDPGYQEGLMDSLKKIANPVFLISEEVLSEES